MNVSKWKILARLVALHCIRNNTPLEDYHCQGKISDPEMRELMLSIEKNLHKELWVLFGHKKILKKYTDAGRQVLFTEYGISWDIPQKTYKKLLERR